MNEPRRDPFERFSQSVDSGVGLRAKSVQGAFFMATTGAVDFVARLGATVVLARLLSPEEFGLVAMVIAFTSLVDLVKDLGLGTATVQRQNITHREISSLYWINALFALLLTLALGALAPTIAWFYDEDRLVLIALPLATTLLFGGMAVQHEALLTRQLRQGPLGLVRLLATLLSSGIAIALATAGYGYWSLVVREITRSFLYMVGVWWYCRWLPEIRLSFKEVKGFLSFGKDLTLTNIVIAVIGKIDGILVGKFFGPVALGVYRQAQNLIMAPIEQFNAPVLGVAQPGLSALQTEPERYCRYYQRVAGIVALVTMPLGIFFAAYSQELTLTVLGERWLPAAPFVAVFGIAAAMRPTVATTSIVLVTLGRSKTLLTLAVAHSLLLTVLMLIGLRWGAVGVAVAHVVTTVILIAPKIHYSFRQSPVSPSALLSAIQVSLLSSVFMGATLIIFRQTYPISHPVVGLTTGAVVGLVAYLLPILLLPSGRAELRTILVDVRASLQRRVRAPTAGAP